MRLKNIGWNNIEHKILFDNLTKEEACEKEIELIAYYKSNDKKYGYNISSGGEKGGIGWVRDKQYRLKMSEAKKGVPSYWKDKNLYEETKEKIRKSSKFKKIKQSTENGFLIGIYNGIREAERVTGIPHSNIIKCIKGERKTAGGYIWIEIK